MEQFGLKIIVTLLLQDSLTSHLAFHEQLCVKLWKFIRLNTSKMKIVK